VQYLYAPWRDEYIKQEQNNGCVFCHISQNAKMDEKHHVLYRNEHCFIVMNRYPYTPGHFMIIPHLHTDAIEELDSDTWLKMSELTQKCVKMLKTGFGAKGVNIGMNLGENAGAGIAEHVHMHIVPRWNKDTNFITTIADTRVYSTDFERIYKKLKSLVPKFI
jgi:diadenosine tetraphosphate (Ap4A) HIT family hydrolase